MPNAFSRTYRVRRYECDAYGHVNNTNYVRYMQEAALEAAASAGYGAEECRAAGREFRTARLDIEYLQPIRYGDTVDVTTCVTHVDGASLCRAFGVRLGGGPDTGSAGGPELMARASTVATFVDCESGRPTAIPPEMAASLAAGPAKGAPDPSDVPQPFPSVPPPPPGVFKLRRRVSWRDLDVSRRVDEAMYLEYLEEASFGVVAAFGWPARRMAAQGFAILLRRHQVEYLQPALLDDELEVATWASDLKRVMATRHYTITRVPDGALLVRMNTLGVWVDLATGRPVRWPEGFMDDFAENIVG